LNNVRGWTVFAVLQAVAAAVGVLSLYLYLPVAFLVTWPATLVAGLILGIKGASRYRGNGGKGSGFVARVVGMFVVTFIAWPVLLLILGFVFPGIADALGWDLASVPSMATFSTGCLAYLKLGVFQVRIPATERVQQILGSPSRARLGLRASSDQIAEAERALGLRLPRSFVEFLTTSGEIEIGATRVLGVGPSHLVPSSSGFVEATLQGRQDLGIPQHFILCVTYPNNLHVCLDTFDMHADEGPAVLWSGTARRVTQTLAPTFGDFLRDQLENPSSS
jgi:hypothetical protein